MYLGKKNVCVFFIASKTGYNNIDQQQKKLT